MTEQQVLLSWQEPSRMNSSEGVWGKRDQWVYDFEESPYFIQKGMIAPDWYGGRYYLYFDNGILDSWQRQR